MRPKVRNGYSDINIEFRVKGNATVGQRSPVYDVVSKSVPVTVTVAK
jgi:hypothetical protein